MSIRAPLLVLVLAILLSLGAGPARAADPTPSPSASDDAATAGQPGVHAEMLAEHELEPMAFSPGEEPTALSADADGAGGELAAAGQGGISGLPNGLFREVFGYLPYWTLNSESLRNLDYALVSTLSYFSIGAQSNGTLAKGTVGAPSSGWRGWTSSAMTDVINAAHARGVKVVPTVTMMAWNGNYTAMSTLLNSPTNRDRLAGEISAAVRLRHADGVNLDFEPVPTSLRSQYTALVRQVKARLVRDKAGSFVTVATMAGAATWNTGYDVAALSASGAADALMVMAYDFHWSGSARAGGVAPIDDPYGFDVRTALKDHLAIVPASKLIWGVPYYGREWSTATKEVHSLTNDVLDSGASYYTYHRAEAAKRGRRWDPTGRVPWYTFRDTAHDTWVQGYYDDVPSLTAKYDLVNGNGLRGIGIWHLLMDGARRELWTAIDTNFQGPWFEDIIGSPYKGDILWIAEARITAGCGPERYCPKHVVTREQMASFLARALSLPKSSRDWFNDDSATIHQGDINRVAQAGISRGCAPERFCPAKIVTREQMASFLARALALPSATRDYFTDDDGSMHEADINRLAQAGITGGCSTAAFCPTSGVNREQMAAFLHRALGS